MKLLMIYTNKFAYKTSRKGLESVSENTEQNIIENALVGFIHVEEKDEMNLSYIVLGNKEKNVTGSHFLEFDLTKIVA